ncbi:MAG: hypothetical protein U9Q07_04295 [Planctomycetota bacterium]|nr:hypothetical protein [Planctomycetota bacterium]
MTTFDAHIRTDYTSVEGLVLDCPSGQLAMDGSLWTNLAPAARVLREGTHTGTDNAASLYDENHFWLTDSLVGCFILNVTDNSIGTITANTEHAVTAVLAGGTDNDWDTNDEYEIYVPRLGSPYQDIVAERPAVALVGGYREADFTAANSSHFKVPLASQFSLSDWTVAFDYVAKAAVGANHFVLSFPNMDVHRQNAAGNYGYRHNAVNQNGVGDLTAGVWLAMLDTATPAGTMWRNGLNVLAGSATQVLVAAGDPAGWIGSDDGATNFCDIILRGMHMWRRHLSPFEADFVHYTISPAAGSQSVYARAAMAIQPWLDETGTSPEVSRLNAVEGYPHRFYEATIPTGTYRRVQIAGAVDGLVLPDSLLGGDLFDIKCIEHASAGVPHVFQSVGWSSVFDIQVNTEGHYTFAVYRDGGGAVVLHLDVVEV